MYRIAVYEYDPRTAEENRTTACHALDGKGRAKGRDYDIDVFHAVATLMERLVENPDAYQLLLLDTQLTGENGVELARFLREYRVGASIIYITDHPPGRDRLSGDRWPQDRRTYQRGADRAQHSPLQTEEFQGQGFCRYYPDFMARYVESLK